MNIHDLKPGMGHVDMRVRVTSVSEPKQVTSGAGIKHRILEATVLDETGSTALVLWNGRIIAIKAGDIVEIRNGFVTSFKGVWRVNVGKYGEITKI